MAPPEKRQRAVALQYDAEKNAAPRVLAKGSGDIAEKILSVARAKGIPLYHDPELVEILGQLDVGKQIEPDLYKAVAEVMIFIYKMNQKKRAAVVGAIRKQNLKPAPAPSLPVAR